MTSSDPASTNPYRQWLRFILMALKYWMGPTRGQAFMLTFLVLLFVLLQLVAQLAINTWNRGFFDALEYKNISDLWRVILLLPLLVAFSAFAVTGGLVSRMTMQTRWREFATETLAGWWIQEQRYYRLGVAVEGQSSPEFRIARDVQLAIEPLVEFAVGLLTAAATASTFVSILWTVGGPLTLDLFGLSIVIPGYLALAAVAYTFAVGVLVYFSGRPLVAAVARKNEMEAQFLTELTRLRENAESIALIRGDADEFRNVIQNYKSVVSAWLAQIRRNGIVGSVQSANGALVPLVPLVLIAPKYIADQLTLGAVMQAASAFVTVQVALNWFIDNFVRVAEWTASGRRVTELIEALESLDIGVIMGEKQCIDYGISDDDKIHIEDLAVAHSNGRAVIADANVVIAAGEKVLVSGATGAGKSTLIRALAGLWPWGSGRILLPRNASIAFIPQKPYIPLGALRQAILYGCGDKEFDEAQIHDALRRCGLAYLIKRLDSDEQWDQALSGGERQRVAFARVLLQRPQIVIMDEATSALDEESEASLLRLLNEYLSNATVISVGHRANLEEFHDRKLTLERRAAAATLTSRNLKMRLWKIFDIKALLRRVGLHES